MSTYVYLLLDDENRVVYVGQTVEPRVRIRTHRASKSFAKALVIAAADANAAESQLIQEICPRLNKTTPGRRKPPENTPRYLGMVRAAMRRMLNGNPGQNDRGLIRSGLARRAFSDEESQYVHKLMSEAN